MNALLEHVGTSPIKGGCLLIDILSRPQVTLQQMAEILPELQAILHAPENRQEEIAEGAEIRIKYKGYIDRERMMAEKMQRLESIKIRGHFDYENLQAISIEARQKLARINPATLGQASRIPGVSPSDINAMLVLMGR